MISLESLRNINECSDYDMAFAIDAPEYLIESAFDHAMLDEAVTAKLQKYKLYFSKEYREAGKLMREAKKALKKGDKAEAKKKATAAKAKYQDLLKKSDEIDDDEFVLVLLDSVVKALVVYEGWILALTAAGFSAGISIAVSTVIGYVTGISGPINWRQNQEPNDGTKHKTVMGTPDVWKPSVSRTEAKTRMKKSIQALDEIIKQVK